MKRLYIFFILIIISVWAVFADPFYINLHNTGISKIKSDQLDDAYKDLRISSFGFLDNKEMLTESYIAMTVIFYRKKDIEGINRYMARLKEIGYEKYLGSVDPYLMGDFRKVLEILKGRQPDIEIEDTADMPSEKSRKDILLEQQKKAGLNLDEVNELVIIHYSDRNYQAISSLLSPLKNQMDSRPVLWLYWGAGQFAERKYRDSFQSLERYAGLTPERDDLYYYVMAHLSARDREWEKADEYVRAVGNRMKFDDYDILRANIDANMKKAPVPDEKPQAVDMGELDRLADMNDYAGIIARLEGSSLKAEGRYAFALANAYFQTQNFSRCIDTINRANTENLSDEEKIRLNYFLGISYINTGNNQSGCQHLGVANRGRRQLEASEAENTVRNIVEAGCMTYNEIVNEYNRNKQDHFNILALAFAEYRQKNYQQSIAYFSVIRNRETNHLYANYYLGINYYHTGNFKESISYYNHLIALGYRFDALYYRLGLSYYGARDHSKAVEYFDKVYDSLKHRSQFMEIYNDAKSRIN